MRALQELFTTDVGLMSAIGLAMMLGMGGYSIYYFLRHIREDAARADLARSEKAERNPR